jgi:hypothetical protein
MIAFGELGFAPSAQSGYDWLRQVMMPFGQFGVTKGKMRV